MSQPHHTSWALSDSLKSPDSGVLPCMTAMKYLNSRVLIKPNALIRRPNMSAESLHIHRTILNSTDVAVNDALSRSIHPSEKQQRNKYTGSGGSEACLSVAGRVIT